MRAALEEAEAANEELQNEVQQSGENKAADDQISALKDDVQDLERELRLPVRGEVDRARRERRADLVDLEPVCAGAIPGCSGRGRLAEVHRERSSVEDCFFFSPVPVSFES